MISGEKKIEYGDFVDFYINRMYWKDKSGEFYTEKFDRVKLYAGVFIFC